MKAGTPVFFAVLLVCSLPAMTLVAADPGSGSQGQTVENVQPSAAQHSEPVVAVNTTNRLPLSDDATAEYTSYGSDLGTTLASGDDALRIDHEVYMLSEHEFDQANVSEQITMAEAAHERLQERIDDLEEREREVVRTHANGEQTTDELTQTLLRNYHEANELETTLNQLESRAERIPGYSLSSAELRADRNALSAFQTQLRTGIDIARESAGADEQYEYVIQTTENGFSLATIEDDIYLLETARFDNRDRSQPDQFEGLESIDRAGELYPWAAADSTPFGQFHGEIRSFHWIEYNHAQGNLKIHLDGGTGDVYREAQDLSIDSLPVEREATVTNDGLALSINQTPANGPVGVTVTDDETGDPIPATVSIVDVESEGDDSIEMGDTNLEDETLWFVPPAGEYEVTAETRMDSVNATVTST
ncbi:DUF7096 domain-containing protein [Natronobacterium gregoryi]|uniref:Uncharacterized protein n=2 Tax=Natronobacterium gregoryi TaxID=44930 RepID=L0AH06_NATGS|nr:hypothetical protein [Natronobacterium gregoryi]AFZ73168.1 hypothetical protein Natgr_1985 [Natronobacterium gregoryi SP2]ELY71106.1 hypothetical protein C490_05572 [Natronobacterium gregoryi SP2]PLK21579.1 hypothetical protein CYV19_03185 [Natronobacterium gregoryi SP2]SFI59682.1 hypothetical protein SAMN05443661_10296 [Natronobacterium gregoryi]